MAERIRLSDRARKRLKALSDRADLEPSFLLEFLINRYGSEAIAALTSQPGALVALTAINGANQDELDAITSTSSPVREPNIALKRPLDVLATMDFDS